MSLPFFSLNRYRETLHLSYQSIKIIVSLIAALYLSAFGFFGVNIYGQIDALIPFERMLCFAAGFFFFCNTWYTSKSLIKDLKK